MGGGGQGADEAWWRKAPPTAMWRNWNGSRVKTDILTPSRSDSCSSSPLQKQKEFETDPATLARRLKQIEYGKNTVGYANYRRMVPKNARAPSAPSTPNVRKKISRRGFDAEIRIWRLLLHAYDPKGTDKNSEEVAKNLPKEKKTGTALTEQNQPFSFRGSNFGNITYPSHSGTCEACRFIPQNHMPRESIREHSSELFSYLWKW